ncbi:MAG: hypothetical protein KJ622_17030 [Alphaproteobacteria bacterium]|nr:hypothetical protein [Alphaproteobacteria bacterium]
MPRFPFLIWLVVSTAWIATIAYIAWSAWPHMPLDISQTDPATLAAYDSAVLMHAGRYAAVALLPPLIILAFLRFLRQ